MTPLLNPYSAFLMLALACNATIDDVAETPPNATAPATGGPAAAAPLAPAAPSTTVLRGIDRPLMTKITDMAMVDRLDIGNEIDEHNHHYAVPNPTFTGTRDFLIPESNVTYTEDGRAMKTAETFTIKVVPHQNNLLIKAFDTLAMDQKVRVSIDDKVVGEWSVPDRGVNRYGEAVFPLSAALIGDRLQLQIRLDYVSGSPDTNAFVYWVFAKPNLSLEAPLAMKLNGLTLTDSLDIGAVDDEDAHHYVIDSASYSGIQQFESPSNGQPFLENGRATKTYETFRMKVMPSRDHLLVKAFDTYSKSQVVRVTVEGKVVGEWTLPDGAPRYGESSFRIPAKFVGERNEVNVRIDFVSASIDANSFQYWMFTEPNVRNG